MFGPPVLELLFTFPQRLAASGSLCNWHSQCPVQSFALHEPGSTMHEIALLRRGRAQELMCQVIAEIRGVGLTCPWPALNNELQLR